MEHQLLRRDDVAQHRVMRKEVVILKDEPHLEAEPAQVFFRPIARRAVRAGGDHRLTVDADFAAVDGFKVVEAAQKGTSVLLPEPLRPMTATTSPLSTRTVTPFKISLSPYFFLMSIA